MPGNPAVPPQTALGNLSWQNWLVVVPAVHVLGDVASSSSPCHIIYICAQCALPWLQEQKPAGMDG